MVASKQAQRARVGGKDDEVVDAHRPDLLNALDFLKQVKEGMPAEYETFLEVLTQFRSQNVNAEMVVTVVAEMLVGRQHLLEGFSNFLPPACREILLERYTEGSLSHRSREADTKTAAKRENADNSEQNRGKEPAVDVVSDAMLLNASKAKSPCKNTQKAKAAGAICSALAVQQFVGEMPVETNKRKRDSIPDRPLRPSPPSQLLTSYAGMGKRMSQSQIWQAQLKKQITPPNIAQVICDLEQRIESLIAEMHQDPDNWIPAVDIHDVLNDSVDPGIMARIRKTGVIKIRGTLPCSDAERLNKDMEQELRLCLGVDPTNLASYENIYNLADPKAFTLGGVQEIYYSRAQFEARQHPHMLRVRVWLNRLWDYWDRSEGKGSPDQLLFLPEAEMCYVDRWRHRLPGFGTQTGMKEHIDNGAMSRWADPAWQSVYKEIMEGNLDSYDPWKGPGDGTLEVVPLVSEAMAYVLLRPFQHDVPVHQLCGVNDTGGGDTLEITSRLHSDGVWHSLLLRAKLPVGHVDPGDSVWWHPDVIHGVEALHQGKVASNVLYIPATPMCEQNAKYMVKQREAFLKGDAPPGFPNLQLERSANRHCSADDLSQAGRWSMGIDPYPESIVFENGPKELTRDVLHEGAEEEVSDRKKSAGVAGYGDAELAARRLLFEQCNAIMFQDTDGTLR